MQANIDETRFDIIAKSYEYAIGKYPEARKDDEWLIEKLDIKEDEKVLEISAGTGFLTEKIAKKNTKGILYAQDIAPKTLVFNKEKCGNYTHLQFLIALDAIPDGSCDKAVSLGGWHHMEDQIEVTKSTLKKLKRDGYFCVGDFSDNSSIQRYFDEIVDKITVTGHQGLFPSRSRMLNIGRFVQASKIEVEEIDVEFSFDSEEDMGDFFQNVFALDQDPVDTCRDIKEYFEVRRTCDELVVIIPYVYAKYIK